jgi:hypothetical protein
MTTSPISFTRIRLIAGNTLLEAARQRLFHFLLFFAVALVLGARWFRDFNFGAPELKFLSDFGFGAMAFFGAALTITATAQLFFSEIENRTVLTLLAKPVGRADFVLGKFFGVAAVTAIFCALLTGILTAVLATRETALAHEMPEAVARGGRIHLESVVAAGLVQWSKLAVLGAFTLLVASFAQSQLFTVIAGFFILVICHLQYLAQESYARAGSAVAQFVGVVIGLLFPNFQLFNLGDELGLGGALAWERVARVELYALGYVAAACALAIYCFRQREI